MALMLSGKKLGTEMLEIGDYPQAAGHVAGRMSAIAWRAMLHFWWLVLIVAGLIAAQSSCSSTAAATTSSPAPGLYSPHSASAGKG